MYKYYLAQVCSVLAKNLKLEVEVSCLRKASAGPNAADLHFVQPNNLNITFLLCTDVVLVLPKPSYERRALCIHATSSQMLVFLLNDSHCFEIIRLL